MGSAKRRSGDPGPPPTVREKEVKTLLAQGLSAQKIADRLGITCRTVNAHMQRATHKLGAANSTNAVAIMIRSGLIVSPSKFDLDPC